MDNNLTEELKDRLISVVNGMLTSNEYDRLYQMICEKLQNYPLKSTLNNFFRVLNTLFDKNNFLKNSLKYDYYIKSLFSVTANSNYLTDILVRNPEFIYLILDTSYTKLLITKNKLKNELLENAAKYKTTTAKINYAKLFKRKYILIIAFNDINGFYSLKKTTLYLSYLANVISEYILTLSINTTSEKYNLNNISRKFSLLSLGKLGGNELNYSSDIDLLFIYDKNGRINRNSKITAEIFFNTALSTFINVMSEITDKGYIYRVDFRLRPDGKNSPLSNSLSSYISYYELRGEDWERQMLLKLGFVGGSKQLFNKFRKFVIPYAFSRSISASPLERIKTMKNKIEYQHDDNIKLCKGGIRDIEFSVQALQLLNGSKIKSLFTGNTLSALVILYKNKIISKDELEAITSSYIFYRKIEHFLQLMNDRQTHTIPYNTDIFQSLLIYFDFSNKEEFQSYLNENKSTIRSFFMSVFGSENIKQIDSKFHSDLEIIHFNDLNRAKKNFNYLKNGTDLINTNGFDKPTTDIFNKFELDLYNILKNSDFPDIILDNFVRGIRSVFFPSIWYKNFLDIEQLKLFTNLCLFSDRAFNLWTMDKKVSDLLLTGRVFYKDFIDNNTHRPVNHLLFIMSFQYAINLINESDVCSFFSKIITDKVKNCYEKLNISSFTILGFGSYGTQSMNFASDIDLMFVTENKDKYESTFKEAAKLIELLKSELYPFKFDFRLRPEGGSSQIVWETESFITYIKKRARIWEFQAFQKAKFICGNPLIYNLILTAYFERVNNIDIKSVALSIKEMRKNIIEKNLSTYTNIKYSQGGLQDIDFLIQFSFFKELNNRYDRLNMTFSERLVWLELIMPKSEIEVIKQNYNFLKLIELANQNIFGVNNSNISSDNMKLKRLILFLGMENTEAFIKKINDTLSINSEIFNKYIGINK